MKTQVVKAQTEKVSEHRVSLQIEVDAARVDEALERAYRKVAREVNVPGFRKGRVPRQIIEARFGKEVLYQDALEELIPEAYRSAVEANNLDVIDQPDVRDVEIEAGSPLRFRAEVDVMPEAQLPEYKGFKVEKLVEQVEEPDIDHMLEHLQDENAQLVSVERDEVQDGDFVTIDFEGFLKGEPFSGGAAKGYTLEIGSGRFIAGFEEQLIGAKVGSEVELKVTFPEDYPSEELKGEEVTFKVRVHQIKERQLPELDDEFAADVSDVETLAELREQIREELASQAEARAEQEVRNRLVELLRDGSSVEVPPVLVEREVDDTINEFAQSLMRSGISPQAYLEETGMTVDDLRERFRPEAENRVKANIALQTLVKREGITVSADEIGAHIESMVANSPNPDEARARWEEPDRREVIERSLAITKAVDFLVEHAEIEVKEIPSRGHGHHHHHDHHDHDEEESGQEVAPDAEAAETGEEGSA